LCASTKTTRGRFTIASVVVIIAGCMVRTAGFGLFCIVDSLAGILVASPFLFGFYNISVWGPIGLGLLAALLGLLIARPAVRTMTSASVVNSQELTSVRNGSSKTK
jgi:hypothetical protein